MITLKENPKRSGSKIDYSNDPQVRPIHVPGTHRNPPEGSVVVTWGVYRAGGEAVDADYFASTPDAWFEDTTISLALRETLAPERLEELRAALEASLNAIRGQEQSYFIEIVAEAMTPEIKEEFGIVGHKSYVPS